MKKQNNRIPVYHRINLLAICVSLVRVEDQESQDAKSDNASTSKQHLPHDLNDHESKLNRADDVDEKSSRRVVDHEEHKADEEAENEEESEFDHLE